MATADRIELRRNRSSCSSSTSFPTTRATRSRWCAAKARTCGTPRGTAISTSSPAGAATCWAIAREPVVEAVQEQVATLIHVPNTWYTEAQGRWAKLLSERSFGGQAFFCNSGTEANEAAIKLARLHTPKERYKIITFERRLSRPHAGCHRRHGPAEVSRRARPADGRASSTPRSATWTPSTS